MSLLDIRTQFVKQSGRVDLVVNTTSYADNGADWFIQSGQRLLDTLLPTQKSSALVEETLSAGEYLFLTDARAVKRISVIDTDNEVYELTQLRNDVYREKYGYKNGDVTSQDRPSYWTVEPIRDESEETGSTTKQVIVVGPTADTTYTLLVEGLFYPKELTSDSDTNFWTERHPDTLVQAALYALERFYRNTQGMRDHMEAIQRDIRGIDFDVVEQEIAITDEMRDSFNERTQTSDRYYGDFGGER